MVVVERVKTGIAGFEELVNGGFPKGNVVLVSGGTGCGKTTFAGQYLYNGAKMFNEAGVYVTLEEDIDKIIKNFSLYGWDIEKEIKRGKLMFIQPELYKYDVLLNTIEEAVDKIGAKRLVIDSLSLVGMYFKDAFQIRKSLLDFNRTIKRLGCTTIATSEVKEGTNELSTFGVEEFVVDGIVLLYLIKKENLFVRAITVRKMRGSSHSTRIHPIIMNANGLEIYPTEELFATMP